MAPVTGPVVTSHHTAGGRGHLTGSDQPQMRVLLVVLTALNVYRKVLMSVIFFVLVIVIKSISWTISFVLCSYIRGVKPIHERPCGCGF